jgi:hypothetical protein
MTYYCDFKSSGPGTICQSSCDSPCVTAFRLSLEIGHLEIGNLQEVTAFRLSAVLGGVGLWPALDAKRRVERHFVQYSRCAATSRRKPQ